MRIYGTFKDQNNATITVIIQNNNLTGNDINIDTSSDIRFSDDPVVITTDCDDSFVHIIKTSATISLVSKSWLGDYLFADNYTSIAVNVLKGSTVLFAGYVTPNTFSQDYAHDWESITINCVDKLSILEDRYITEESDYETIKANVTTKTFMELLDMMGLDDNDLVLQGSSTPSIYYDCSKSYGNYGSIFDGLMIAEGLFVGDDEDDLWSNEEILEEMMRYLNLHIFQSGYNYYIFDWENLRNSNIITWKDITDTQSAAIRETRGAITVRKNDYGSDDTQLSIADVYNQVQVRDDIEELETVIASPFDDDKLIPIGPKQKYLVEYGTNGCSTGAMTALTLRAKYNQQPQTDKAYTREWWMQVFQNAEWSFKLNGVDVYDHYAGQSAFLKYLFETPFASAAVGFGSGSKVTNKNSQNIENIDVKDKYILLNIMGTGVDEKSSSSPKWPSNWTTAAHPVWPNESTLQNLNMEIAYNYGVDGSYSPGSPDVTNYLVFNGEILMTTVQETLGVSGFDPHASWGPFISEDDTPYWERNNQYTQDANDNRTGHWGDGNYVDFLVSTRKNNNFITAKTHLKTWLEQEDQGYKWYGSMTPDESEEKGHYYMQQYYNDNGVADEGHIYLSPPIVQGNLSKRFNYRIGEKTSYYKTDVIKYVDILTCELKIGTKICCEGRNNGDKVFTWYTQEEIDAINAQHPSVDDNDHVFPFIYLAINIDDGEFLIGDTHKIYNNIHSDMGLEKTTGMAIPIRSTDNVSGTISFKIIGPVNNTWDNGVRRHPTWFRNETLTQNYVSILPHVGQIWIKNLDVKLVSDNGKQTVGANDDIIYCSDEQNRFIKKKDDIDFKFTTALTAAEAAELGVTITVNKSDVIGADTNIPITAIHNNVTNETDKPEKFYVDAYYREYCNPKIIMDSTMHIGAMLGKYSVGYLNRNFMVQGMEHNVITAKKKLKMKEI